MPGSRTRTAGTLAAFLVLAGQAHAQTVELWSTSSEGNFGNIESHNPTYGGPSLSEHARYIAFESRADNLVPGDFNTRYDVFRKDRYSGKLIRISENTAGEEADAESRHPVLTPCGRWVTFGSFARNMAPNTSGTRQDIFVKDLETNLIERVSLAHNGAQGNASSADPRISDDARYVVYWSDAKNIVPNDTNAVADIFMWDRQTAQPVRLSLDSNGVEGNGSSTVPAMSGDASIVVFQSDSDNLIDDDNNIYTDIFLRDVQAGTTVRISNDMNGGDSNGDSFAPACSSDGRYIVYHSDASDLVANDNNGMSDIFLYDVQTGTTTRVSVDSNGVEADGGSYRAEISYVGDQIVYASEATNLVDDDTNGLRDVFWYNVATQETLRVSTSTTGVEGDDHADWPALSGDGEHIVYVSRAKQIVPKDPNKHKWDVFIYTSEIPAHPYCTAKQNSCGTLPTISSTGVPSASQSSGFTIRADNTKALKAGLLLYTENGPAAVPFMGGTLCLAGPLKRSVVVNDLGGTSGQCDGVLSLDMNAFASGSLGGGPLPSLQIAGQRVNCQYWGRDTAGNSLLSDGLSYTVGL